MRSVQHKASRRPLLKAFLCVLLAVALIAGGYVAYVFASYYRLEDNLSLQVENLSQEQSPAQTGITYTAVSYNVGFGAYTPEFTFFMDGGESSWAASKESVLQTIGGSAAYLQGQNADLVLLQEIDLDSTRSYHIDQSVLFREALPAYCYALAMNYDSPFLFYPFTQPHGKSVSALGVYSRFPIRSALRRSLPVSQSLSKILDLDRCYSINRISVENGRELVVYNVHMSAYGNSHEVREGQKRMLQADMAADVAAGNYVICGGDFNHDLLAPETLTDVESWAYPYPRSYLPEGMSFCLDLVEPEVRASLVPTCRYANIPYDPAKSQFFTVDGFIVSQNIRVVAYATADNQFAFSDHNPVVLQFQLEP